MVYGIKLKKNNYINSLDIQRVLNILINKKKNKRKENYWWVSISSNDKFDWCYNKKSEFQYCLH